MNLSRGILTGCDKKMELFLPWWFDHLQKHNDLPIGIIDYGLSEWGKRVAKKIGTVIPRKKIALKARKHQPSKAFHNYRCNAHEFYMYKPFGLMHSPFKHTLWIDIDCKVLSDLTPLFNIPHFGVVPDHEKGQQWASEHQVFSSQHVKSYNSGVLSIKKGCPLLKTWAERVQTQCQHFVTDDMILSEVIAEKKHPITSLKESYNFDWEIADQTANIIHYRHRKGKFAIMQEMLIRVCT